jgi:benzodiazapine receptor
MHKLVSLTVFLCIVVAAAAIGGQFTGGEWYRILIKPPWNPSAILLTPAWAVLYILMAVSAWLVWCAKRGPGLNALAWWGLQLLLNIAFSWVFFELHRIGWAQVVLSLWLLVAIVVIRRFKPINLEASNLMIPLACWLVFAWVLNLFHWHLNGGGLGSVF